MKIKTIIFLTIIFTVIFSAITSSYIVNADELDGYTKVDWSWIIPLLLAVTFHFGDM